jgi:UDP-glucose 4-epimerase
LVEALAQRGCHVLVLDNFSTGCAANLDSSRDSIDIMEVDVRNCELLGPAMRGVDIV